MSRRLALDIRRDGVMASSGRRGAVWIVWVELSLQVAASGTSTTMSGAATDPMAADWLGGHRTERASEPPSGEETPCRNGCMSAREASSATQHNDHIIYAIVVKRKGKEMSSR